MYKGKSASQWATEFAFHTTEEARDALNHLGADATPFLVPYLDKPDSLLNSFYYKLWERLPRIIQKKFLGPVLASDGRQHAAIAFRDIQPVSRPAIPVLIQHLNSRDVTVQLLSQYALGNLGPEATAAVPALKLRLKGDVAERVYAAWALWQIEHNAAEVLPIFEEALDRKYGNPWLVMGFLAAMGSAAEHAVPLIEAVAEEDRVQPPRVLSQALQALARISTNTVRFLIKHLKHMDPGIRVSAAVALGNIGPPAAASVGSLEALLQDQEVGMQYIRDRHLYPEPVAHAAREALDKILGKSTEDSKREVT